jgi:uncharacterized protein (TIGR03083 family)
MTTLPAELRQRVLDAATSARAVGRPAASPPRIAPVEAMRRAAVAFDDTLLSLTPTQWSQPALRDLDVQGLVGHLIGMEHDVRRALLGDRDVADIDHVVSTQDEADGQIGLPVETTRLRWRLSLDETLDRVTDMDTSTPIALHGMRLPLGALLVVRAFELWTHENDIRRVAGLPPSDPDAQTLALMTDLAARMLPRGAAKAEVGAVELHLVLTGAGGGVWDVRLGDVADAAEVMVVADAADFCRLVADRLRPEELDVHATGDPAAVRDVLVAAAALALD